MALLFGVLLPALVKAELEEWLEESKSVNIFITGKTGTGKTTLVNGLMGRIVSVEGNKLDPGTRKVTKYGCKVDDIEVNVWDTPGLQDSTRNEAGYIQDIKSSCKEVDLFIYCIRMSETRFVRNNPDIISMRMLTETLGKGIWNNALIILTFANDVVDMGEERHNLKGEALEKFFYQRVKDWKTRIHTALKEEVGIPADTVQDVDVVPAGYHSTPQLMPDSECWLGRLWLEALLACNTRAQPALIKVNEHRLKTQSEVDTTSLEAEFLYNQPLIIGKKGAEIGSILGVPGIGFATGLRSGMTNSVWLMIELAVKNKIISSDTNMDPDTKG